MLEIDTELYLKLNKNLLKGGSLPLLGEGLGMGAFDAYVGVFTNSKRGIRKSLLVIRPTRAEGQKKFNKFNEFKGFVSEEHASS
jgi:hypothetical protein